MEELEIISEKHNNEIKRIKAQLLADIAMEMVKNATRHTKPTDHDTFTKIIEFPKKSDKNAKIR